MTAATIGAMPRQQLKLSFLAGRANPAFFLLQTDHAVLGSSPQCDICFKDPLIPPGALLLQEVNGSFVLRLANAQSVVLVNGTQISAQIGEEILSNGTVIEIGKFKLRAEIVAVASPKTGAPNNKVTVNPPFSEGAVMTGPPQTQTQTRRINHIEAALNAPAKKKQGGSFFKQIAALLLLSVGAYYYLHNPSLHELVAKYAHIEKASELIKGAVSALQSFLPDQSSAVAQGGAHEEDAANLTSVAQLLKYRPPKLPPPLPAALEASLS